MCMIDYETWHDLQSLVDGVALAKILVGEKNFIVTDLVAKQT